MEPTRPLTRAIMSPRRAARLESLGCSSIAMQVECRRAEPNDSEAIADVYLRSRKELVTCAPLVHPDVEVRLWIRDGLIPSGSVTVAVVEGRVVGFMAVSKDAESSWVGQLYVLPESVGRGVGSRLLEVAREELSPPIRLYTFQANQRARVFYERHGFVAVAFGDGSGNEERCPDILYEWMRE
ncbi:MAG: N-acetyltransferase family protein [Pirellulaceae bacterium]